MPTPKRLVALLADTQLHKELYGIDATRQDWFDAFFSAIRAIKARIHDISCVLILGDVLDKEEVGSRAAYALLQGLRELAPYEVPVGMVLGNHDNLTDVYSPANSDGLERVCINWIRVCQQANPFVRELSLTEPLLIPADGPIPALTILGANHRPRAQILRALADLQPPAKAEGEIWLCLHQALQELSAHVSNWEVTAQDVPSWVHRVFLGDFHDHLSFRDKAGRDFVYPGSTETVSFNQSKTPGFILFDRSNQRIEHVSTQQREYLTFELQDIDPGQWESLTLAKVQESQARFHKAPVVRVYYPPAQWGAWSLIEAKLAPHCLRISAIAAEDTASEVPEDKSELAVPASREDVKQMAQDLLAVATSDQIAQDCLTVLNDIANLQAIRERSFPGAVYRPSKTAAQGLLPIK